MLYPPVWKHQSPGWATPKNKQEQAHTKLPSIYWPPAQLHLAFIQKLILGGLPSKMGTATSQELSTNVAWTRSSEEPTMLHIPQHILLLAKQKA